MFYGKITHSFTCHPKCQYSRGNLMTFSGAAVVRCSSRPDLLDGRVTLLPFFCRRCHDWKSDDRLVLCYVSLNRRNGLAVQSVAKLSEGRHVAILCAFNQLHCDRFERLFVVRACFSDCIAPLMT
jgi:hypothetical protein